MPRSGRCASSASPGCALPVDVPGDTLTAEQSNTSLVFGEATIAKFFRRLDPGINPDVEVHDALRVTDNPHIAPLLGYVTVDIPGSEEAATVAMAQKFLPAASDGWALALTSVRDLYAEAICTRTRSAATSRPSPTGSVPPRRRCTPTWPRCCPPATPSAPG